MSVMNDPCTAPPRRSASRPRSPSAFASVRATHARARRAALGRGLRGPVDARREPGEVAPRAHDLVLRDLRARAARARLPPFDPAFRVLFNSYYNARGRPAPAARARAAHRARRSTRCSRIATHVDDAMRRPARGRRAARRAARAGRAGHAPRAAAPGADPHRPQAPALAQSAAPGLPEALAAHADAARASRAGSRSPAALHEIGHDGEGFAFDNEGPRHRVWLDAFEIASHPVTNGEFLALHRGRRLPPARAVALRRLGRGRARAAGRRRCTGSSATASWHTFTLHGMAPVEPNTPVCHVSYYEADAFARWAGARLPTEAEWEVAAAQRAARRQLPRERRAAPARAARSRRPRARSRSCSATCGSGRAAPTRPTRASSPRPARSASTTASSCATSSCCAAARARRPRSHIRATYRNFFPADARWQFSGAAPRARRADEPRTSTRAVEHYRDLAPRYDQRTRRINRIRERTIAALELSPATPCSTRAAAPAGACRASRARSGPRDA